MTSSHGFVMHHGHHFLKTYLACVHIVLCVFYPLLWLASLIPPPNYGTVHHLYWLPFSSHRWSMPEPCQSSLYYSVNQCPLLVSKAHTISFLILSTMVLTWIKKAPVGKNCKSTKQKKLLDRNQRINDSKVK